MASKVLVLHSGGMDSTVCLYEAHSRGLEVVSFGVDYDQRHSVEMLYAQKQCENRNIERQIVHVTWSKPHREIPLDRDPAAIRVQQSPAFLPGRNTVFLALATAHAAGIGAEEVVIGINRIDFSGYPDCTEEFLEAYKAGHKLSFPNGPIISAPLLNKTKPEIARLAVSLGIGRYDTWSCYRPQTAFGKVEPCGRCDACTLHDFAWSEITSR
jgi:7-cyano-7-deazaguanine synthase